MNATLPQALASARLAIQNGAVYPVPPASRYSCELELNFLGFDWPVTVEYDAYPRCETVTEIVVRRMMLRGVVDILPGVSAEAVEDVAAEARWRFDEGDRS